MTRQETLSALVQFREPLAVIEARLSAFEWDWNGAPLVTLTRRQIVSVLKRFVSGEIDAETVERWADLIECRDGIEDEPGHEELVLEAIHHLANPILHGSLEEIASNLMARLE